VGGIWYKDGASPRTLRNITNRFWTEAYWFGTKRVELGPILALGVVCDEYPSSYQGSIVPVQRNVTEPKVEERNLAAGPARPPVLSRLSQRNAPSSKTNPEHIAPVTQTTRHRKPWFIGFQPDTTYSIASSFWRIPRLEVSLEKHFSGTEVTAFAAVATCALLICRPRCELLLRDVP
jgi:hypothetical protein